ncbi:MAG: PKD domain-containing protein [Bacteroidetes bacterium]|nr:PKD domain-containing protein [Bacteroidota bacterium]
MYKKCLLILLFIFVFKKGTCNNILGGHMYANGFYSQGNTGFFTLQLDLYAACINTNDTAAIAAQFPSIITIAIYADDGSNTLYQSIQGIRGNNPKSVSGGYLPNCILNAGLNCYISNSYSFNVKIPGNLTGFTVIYESCCRADSLTNVNGSQGLSITTKLIFPGYPFLIIEGGIANYPYFFNDNNNTVVCAKEPFSLSLLPKPLTAPISTFSYHLTPGFGSSVTIEKQTVISKGKPLVPLIYDTINGFDGYFPLGKSVSIDTLTGVLSGIAPAPGNYLINVIIKEYVEGSTIIFSKQFTLRVRSCHLDAIKLDSVRILCDSLKVSFANQASNTGIVAYQWQFLQNNTVIGSASDSTPKFVFPDTGSYTIKLKVTNTAGCRDSAIQQLSLYPFLKPGFTISGNCIQQPYVFTDTSTTSFGSIQNRHWDFGDQATLSDTSIATSPTYQYATKGIKTIQLTVSNTKGCVATMQKTLEVTDKPPLMLFTHDTLICSIDTLKLQANGQGIISWAPSYNILGAQSASPSVFPKQTTRYIATLNANGCINTDTVTVNVLDYITVDAGADLSICLQDSTQLKTISKATSFLWSPAKGLSSSTTKSPVAAPISNTQYIVTANLGKCQAKDTVVINVYPYPIVDAGNDTLICSGSKAFLKGVVNTTNYYWSSSRSLSDIYSLTPIAIPKSTTKYVLTGFQQSGCIKPVSDTVVVTVDNSIAVDAGRDTSVFIGQPLQLHASGGGSTYTWSPKTGLSDANIPDPIVILDGSLDYIKYFVTTTANGCEAQDDVVVKIVKSKPDIYVPSAFSPNRDGRNDYLRAIPVGIKTFLNFDIYQRWGGLVFHTTDPLKAWDGRIQGQDQPNGVYIYIARGIDYLGNLIEKKGTVIILR